MGLRFLAALAAFLLLPSLASAQVSGPPPPPAPPQFAPQPGMQFTGTLWQGLSSKTANVGDPVVLTNVISTDDTITGARMFGHVVAVTRAGEGRNAQIYLSFDTLQMQNGQSYPVVGEVTRLEVKTPNNGAKEALGALGGLIVGNVIGKWIGLPVNVGAVAGATGGYLIAKNSRENINIPANSNVGVRLVRPRPQAPQQGAPPYAPAEPQPPPPPGNPS
jgi:hypothetical protein